MRQVVAAVERQGDEPIAKHRQHQRRVLQVKCCLGEHRFAGEEGFVQALGDLNSPLVVGVVTVGEGHQEAGVGDALHGRMKPLRRDRSLGPRTAPARRM